MIAATAGPSIRPRKGGESSRMPQAPLYLPPTSTTSTFIPTSSRVPGRYCIPPGNPAVVSREVGITSREARAGNLEDSGGCFCRSGGFPEALPALEDSSVNNNYDLLFWRIGALCPTRDETPQRNHSTGFHLSSCLPASSLPRQAGDANSPFDHRAQPFASLFRPRHSHMDISQLQGRCFFRPSLYLLILALLILELELFELHLQLLLPLEQQKPLILEFQHLVSTPRRSIISGSSLFDDACHNILCTEYIEGVSLLA